MLPKWLYTFENSRSVMLNRQTVDLGSVKLATRLRCIRPLSAVPWKIKNRYDPHDTFG